MNTYMKSKLLFFGLFFVFAFALIAGVPDTALGQAFNYTPLENIPGAKGVSSFPDYIQGIYKFGIWTVGLAALFMLSVGGFVYLSSGGNTATIGKAKTYIWDAIIGLVLALLAYLILYVINPDLVNVNLDRFSQVGGTVTSTVQPSQSSGNPIPNSGITPQLPNASIQAVAQMMLSNGNIGWDMNANCSKSGPTPVTTKSSFEETASGKQMTACHKGCNHSTSLCNGKATMSSPLINSLNGFAINGNRFTITSVAGGSHSNNSKHYQGLAVDIIPIGQSFQQARDKFNKMFNVGANPVIAYCDNGSFCDCSVAHHLHIQAMRW